jgi:hypothetical protein
MIFDDPQCTEGRYCSLQFMFFKHFVRLLPIGIWRKEIHRRTGNLPQQEFDKILKALEGRKIVKQVSSVQVRIASFIACDSFVCCDTIV